MQAKSYGVKKLQNSNLCSWSYSSINPTKTKHRTEYEQRYSKTSKHETEQVLGVILIDSYKSITIML